MPRSRRRREVPTPSLTVTLSRPTVSSVHLTPTPTYDALREVEDRRAYHPLGASRPAKFTTGGTASYTLKDTKRPTDRFAGLRKFPNQTKAVVAFDDSRHPVAVCVRRKQRKEVLFALNRAGRGGKKRRPPRRNYHSNIRC